MTKKNLITVITDHQLTADTIATVIGATEKHNGYYYGNGYAVTWTNGSVIEATFKPKESFVLSSDMDPMLVFATTSVLPCATTTILWATTRQPTTNSTYQPSRHSGR